MQRRLTSHLCCSWIILLGSSVLVASILILSSCDEEYDIPIHSISQNVSALTEEPPNPDFQFKDRPYRHPLQYDHFIDGEKIDKDKKDKYGVTEVYTDDGFVIAIGDLSTTSGDTKSGRIKLKTKQFEKTELKEKDKARHVIVLTKIDPKILELSESTPYAQEELIVCGFSDPKPTKEKTKKKIAAGDIQTEADYANELKNIIEFEQLDISTKTTKIEKIIEKVDGSIIYKSKNMPCVVALVEISKATILGKHKEISRISLNHKTKSLDDSDLPPQELGRGTVLMELVRGHQTEQFNYNYGPSSPYTGYPNTNGNLAIFEAANLYPHSGFNSCNGIFCFNRMLSCTWCDANPCRNCLSTDVKDDHGTHTASIILGDLTEGQIPSIESHRRKWFSGHARDASFHYYATWNQSGMIRAFDDLLSKSQFPKIANLSMCTEEADDQCLGTTLSAFKMNSFFEKGILPIVAAGNLGHDDPNDCTTTQVANALGSFTVGAHGVYVAHSDSLEDVRHGELYRNTERPRRGSGRGGTSSEGRNRTIVDITAYGGKIQTFDENNNVAGFTNATSAATPSVSGAAIVLRDWYINNISNFIDDPGVLFSMLLLMGDRESENGVPLQFGYDSLWGAGRLKLRKFDNNGMDNWSGGPYSTPVGIQTYEICIRDGNDVYVPLNGLIPFPTDVNILKSTLYWYTPNHHFGNDLDDVDMYLLDGSWNTIRSSLSRDNKERIFFSSPGGKKLTVKLRGYDINTDSTYCGANSIPVYLSVMYEDSDRESGEYMGPCDPYGLQSENCPSVEDGIWAVEKEN